MALIRSLLHLLVMIITVIPYTSLILLVRVLGGSPAARYRVARAWLALCVDTARPLHIRVSFASQNVMRC